MTEQLLTALTGVIVLGVGAQWLAWRLRVPSILLLLGLGFVVGPLSTLVMDKPLLDPDLLMGDLLLPFVSLSVALILYEGGLSLRFAELHGAGVVLWRLVTVGALATWIIAAGAAWLILGLRPALAVLLGAILVVTGPTVIIPLLREIRPKGRVGTIVKWEGIVIDPIGAMLAVLVFEAILLGGLQQAVPHVAAALVKTVVVGGGFGVLAGLLLALMLRWFWIPDFLQNAVSLMFVVGAYTAAQLIQSESGLFAATIMGITLANQRQADIRHIVEFKENLQVLLVSSLFILLAARLQLETFQGIGPAILPFLIALLFVARPVAVLLSTLGSSITRSEYTFLSLMAPRGIVAASVSAVFSLRLMAEGFEEARGLVPLTFMAIVGTVLYSSIVAPLAARRLGVAEPNPQGLLIVGAHQWGRALAALLKSHGLRVLMVDSNHDNIVAARMEGLDAYEGSIVGEGALDQLDLGGIGRLLAITPNNLVNVLASNRFARIFGRAEVYQVAPPPPDETSKQSERHLEGRILAGPEHTFARITDRVRRGATFKATAITAEFPFQRFRNTYGPDAVPMFLITESKRLIVITADQKIEPKPGQTLIALVDETKSETRKAEMAKA